MLEKMIDVGMNIARLNFSHGSYEYHGETISNIHTAVKSYSSKLGLEHPLAIALDTKGPEIRTGLLQGDSSAEVALRRGDTIQLTTNKEFSENGNGKIVYVDYANIVNVVKKNNRVFVDDGLISLIINEVSGDTLTCTIENDGMNMKCIARISSNLLK